MVKGDVYGCQADKGWTWDGQFYVSTWLGYSAYILVKHFSRCLCQGVFG